MPVIIIELCASGEVEEEYGLYKLEELSRKKCIEGIITYDIGMFTQDITKMCCFMNLIFDYGAPPTFHIINDSYENNDLFPLPLFLRRQFCGYFRTIMER